MSYRQLFFIEGRLVGEAPREKCRCHETFREPTSDMFFCSHCGEVYARLPCFRPDGSSTPWQSHRAMCRKCGSAHQSYLSQWPGSIWKSWEPEFLATLPVSVLQWELERHLDAYERIPNGYQ